MTGVNLDHLLPDARRAVVLSDEERIDLIRSTECWVGYARAEAVLAHFDQLFSYGPGRIRPPNALIVASSNNGKSTLIERFRRDHDVPSADGADAETIPVVVVQMPTEPTVSRFYAMLLAELGAPGGRRVGRGARKHDLECLAIDVLRGIKVRVLIIDELHNLLAGRQDTRREFLNLLRYLGNTLRIPVIGAGTRDAYLAIRNDPQLENRFEPLALPLWEADVEMATLVASFTTSLPLRRPSPDLRRAGILRTIIARSGGTIGEILNLVRASAVAAIETGEEAITPRALENAVYRGPEERRAALERDLPRSAAR